MREAPITALPTQESPGRWSSRWTWLAAFEVLLAATFVLLDLAIPSVLLVLLAAVSLAVRRQGPSSLGFRRPRRHHIVVGTAAFAVAWSVVQMGVTMPLASHLSGQQQDVGVFADVEGDLALLLLLLLLSWTLGALVEEIAFRGFLLTRLREVLGQGAVALTAAVLLSSVLFGVLHSEQGVVGVLAVTLDGVAFCLLRLHYGTLWAAVLAHGFNNTLGLVTFYLIGPVYGFW
jgi:membrane protease YdiL (CAAX protease family)